MINIPLSKIVEVVSETAQGVGNFVAYLDISLFEFYIEWSEHSAGFFVLIFSYS